MRKTGRSACCLLASLRRVAAPRERGTVIPKCNPPANLPKKIFTPKARLPNRHFVGAPNPIRHVPITIN
jgi:hypothetical protein